MSEIEGCICGDLGTRRGAWLADCPAAAEHERRRDLLHRMPTSQRCAGCGHRWEGCAPVVLCGDCWRVGREAIQVPDVLHRAFEAGFQWCANGAKEQAASSSPDPLHQQAEALAKQIADRLNNHWADDTSVPDVIALIVPVLQDLRERVQAETREEDAKIADEHVASNAKFFRKGRTRHDYSEVDAAQREAESIAAAIRARKDRP